ncbi:MAG TPA: aminoglycoside phosphotransferase family protein [Anaerolineales bacterium]|nr:aminoglycoside phosphotransferase family protein [Anaerolineales bacterium]
MNISMSTPIAEGRTAEIYLWDERHILKLYREWCPPDWVEYEARIGRAVYEAGVPTPATGEIVEVAGRRGLLYERIEGKSMLQEINARPWTLLKQARALAELQATINRQSISGLPLYTDRLNYDIRHTEHLDQRLQTEALALLGSLPSGTNLCHGDYHPGNVLITQNGPVVIDWITASAGSPWADAARTSLILTIGAKAAGDQVRPIVRLAIRLYHRIYLGRYNALMLDPNHELERWMPVIAAARLSENIIPEREALIRIVKEGLAG